MRIIHSASVSVLEIKERIPRINLCSIDNTIDYCSSGTYNTIHMMCSILKDHCTKAQLSFVGQDAPNWYYMVMFSSLLKTLTYESCVNVKLGFFNQNIRVSVLDSPVVDPRSNPGSGSALLMSEKISGCILHLQLS